MKEIKLTNGKTTKVSDEMFDFLSQWRWQAQKKGNKWYAVRSDKNGHFRMHRVITNAPQNMDVDHIDGDSLNNQVENLRVCTHAQNLANIKRHVSNTSGYKGVTWYKALGKWQAKITVNGKDIHLSYFHSAEEAAKKYDEAAKKYFGEFASLNFE